MPRTTIFVRCSGRLHRVSWDLVPVSPIESQWSTPIVHPGAISLMDHPNNTPHQKAMNTALRELGDDQPRCFQILEKWRSLMHHGLSGRRLRAAALPRALTTLASRTRTYASHRRMFEYSIPGDVLESPIEYRFGKHLLNRFITLVKSSQRYTLPSNTSFILGNSVGTPPLKDSLSTDAAGFGDATKFCLTAFLAWDWWLLYKRGQALVDGYVVMKHLEDRKVELFKKEHPEIDLTGFYLARALRQLSQYEFWTCLCIISEDNSSLKFFER